jgi:DNA-directed RNA polymerase sigma subunit (sigma70/sigma32)
MTIRNEALLAARQRLKLTQPAAAERCGVTKSAFRRIEKLDFSQRNIMEVADKIALGLGVPVDDFMPDELIGQVVESKQVRTTQVDADALLAMHARTEQRLILPAPGDLESSGRADPGELAERLSAVLDTLTWRQREIVKRRFGIGCVEETLDEVGARFRLTRESIRSICNKALRKLEHPVRAGKLVSLAVAAGIDLRETRYEDMIS